VSIQASIARLLKIGISMNRSYIVVRKDAPASIIDDPIAYSQRSSYKPSDKIYELGAEIEVKLGIYLKQPISSAKPQPRHTDDGD
jgi:hypothetical protein